MSVVFWLASIVLGGPPQTAGALDFSGERIGKSGKSVMTAHIIATDDRWGFKFAHPHGGTSVIIPPGEAPP